MRADAAGLPRCTVMFLGMMTLSTNLIPGRTPETAIIALSYGFVLAAQIKSKL